MKKYTDEQLSRILGEHDAKRLVYYGQNNWRNRNALTGKLGKTCGCINQVAYNIPSTDIAEARNPEISYKFDEYYQFSMTAEEMPAFCSAPKGAK